MNNVHASAERGVLVPPGSSHNGKFLSIWVGAGGDGNIAISNDGGQTFITWPAVPGGAFFNVAGNFIGSAGQGTTATSLVASSWGPVG